MSKVAPAPVTAPLAARAQPPAFPSIAAPDQPGAGAPAPGTGTVPATGMPSLAGSLTAGGDTRPGSQPRARLDKALQGATAKDPHASYSVDGTSNAATFLSGSFDVTLKPGFTGPRPEVVSREFLKEHGALFGIEDPASQLQVMSSERDALGLDHVRFQQTHQGLPVFGQQLVLHAKDARVTAVNGRITPNIDLSAVERPISAEEAFDGIMRASGTGAGGAIADTGTAAPADPTLPSLKPAGPHTLGIYTAESGAPRMAWELDIESPADSGRWRYYVDAQNGSVLDSWSLMPTTMHRETYDAGGRNSRPGKLVLKEGDAPGPDPVANRAHDNAGAVYQYFNEQFGRDSIDGKGMKLKSTVHYGDRYNNAFWDGRQMTYGDGDGERFVPLGNALDVVGHEMAHGITERTAGMRYVRQSGALNESWSDVFGNIIEQWQHERTNPGAAPRDAGWLIGEDIFTPKVDGDALRSMSRPGTAHPNDPQPAHMRDYKNVSHDNGGVHINSGIPNKAAYEAAQAIGTEKLGQIWYRALVHYLTPTSQFVDAANATVQSAADLYGADSPELTAVRDAWVGVGIEPAARKR